MRLKNKQILMVSLAVTLVTLPSCGEARSILRLVGLGKKQAAAPVAPVQPITPEATKIGEPYEAAGQTITPRDEVNYDEVGYASWYGSEVGSATTGNGEVFNPDGISAAHRTLPMPSYAEVTDLNTGRTILVRINDRGPFAKGRILDLSAGAARQLGVQSQGSAPVRVRRVNPPEYERNTLRNGGQATERLPTPPGLLNALKLKLKDQPAPKDAVAAAPIAKPATKPMKPPMTRPAPKPVMQAGADFSTPVVSTPAPKPMAKPTARPAAKPDPDDRFVVEDAGSSKPHWKPRTERPASVPVSAPVAASAGDIWYVQIGAFSSAASAKALAGRAGAGTITAGNITRVRSGPYASEAAARQALGGLRAKGYRDAKVTR